MRRAELIDRLWAAGCVAADEEADEMLAASHGDGPTLEAWIARREQGEPLAWITGTSTFCGRPVFVAAGVYVPRFQTEELARRAAAVLAASAAGPRALDLCTGSGAVAAHLLASVPGSAVVGVDLDPRAVACARRNGVPAVVADVAALPFARPPVAGFDVVTAVAPYVPTDDIRFLPRDVQQHEPRRALDGGADGLELVRLVVAAAAHVLHAGGVLLLEVGGDQDALLAPDLDRAGFVDVTSWHDEDGDLRGVAAVLSH
ncbi:MAG TPA: HemK family protein methyltransferase [Acidimicrobiales bacterium]|nr:HemK family protein methyltransferase [Acidimicrobiales bacterium]